MSVQKTVQDYYEQISNEYPEIPIQDIKRILLYGFKSLYLTNSYGADVLINRKDFWFYCGRLMNDSIKYFHYYKRKMITKLRIMYKRKHIQWDGYYYFALTKNQYEEYLGQKNKKGRPRKRFKFSKIILYKIYDECNLAESNRVAIFRVPWTIEKGLTMYKEELEVVSPELVLEREPLKFNDILWTVYNYQFLSDDARKYKKKVNNAK